MKEIDLDLILNTCLNDALCKEGTRIKNPNSNKIALFVKNWLARTYGGNLIKAKSGTILVVEVPELAFYFDWKWSRAVKIALIVSSPQSPPMASDAPTIVIYWETEDNRVGCAFTKFTDPNQFEIVGKLSELADEKCEVFVEIAHEGGVDIGGEITQKVFKDYSSKGQIHKLFFEAKESFISLLQSKGIDTSKEQLIIKTL